MGDVDRQDIWKLEEKIDKVIDLLERIAKALEKPEQEKKKRSRPAKAEVELRGGGVREYADGNPVNRLIGAYIDAFRRRYGAKARPDVGGRVQGLMRNMLKDHPAERLVAIVQAYLQMDDPWFKTKCHDFVTLYENLGKVQTALLNGTAKAEDSRYWSRVFGETGHDEGNLPEADRTIAGELPRDRLQGGARRALLEGAGEDE